MQYYEKLGIGLCSPSASSVVLFCTRRPMTSHPILLIFTAQISCKMKTLTDIEDGPKK